jgi:hypothetical protein
VLKNCKKLVPGLWKEKRKFGMSLPRKHKLPMFLDLNAEKKQKLQLYSKEHLHELSVELVSEYIHDVINLTWFKKDIW